MPNGKRHVLAVEIECLDAQGARQAEARLIRWLEAFGHTSSGSGFKFFSVGRIAAKPIRGRIKKPEKG